MELDFLCTQEQFNEYESIYTKISDFVFKFLNINCDPIISVSFVDNETIHSINKEYRQIDHATDVISFAFLDGEEDKSQILATKVPVCLGDIYISLDKAKEQSEEYGHSLHRELCFLYVHGLLHLLGYDHMNKDDEKIMFKLQDDILSQLGVNK